MPRRPVLAAVLIGLVLVVALAVLAMSLLAWRPAIDPIEPPLAASFDRTLVARGAKLEATGDCNACHTAPGGASYAGGRAIGTPFGTIYSTNITPDAATGIGRWSEAAFVRAMREGVDREGHQLYPVFPYDFFHIVGDEDLRALYAFLMTRTPVSARAPRNALAFPLGFRPLLAGWKLLFLDRGRWQADPSQSAQWQRGAYLVEGLGHCGACHTSRNAFGAVEKDRKLAGGEAEGWIAPALDSTSPAPIPWTPERLAAYLRNEVVPMHQIPAGPMLPVAHNLETLDAQDVDAIATYVASFAGQPTAERRRRAEELVARAKREETPGFVRTAASEASPELRDGAAIYAGACAICHGSGRGLSSGHAIHLALTTSLALPAPTNAIHVVEDGVIPRHGERGRWMPAFRGVFTDQQLESLLAYLRAEFGPPGEPWHDVGREVRRIRASPGTGSQPVG